jgi:hypothetical protein
VCVVSCISPFCVFISTFQVLNSRLCWLTYHDKSLYVKQGSTRKTQDIDVRCQRRNKRRQMRKSVWSVENRGKMETEGKRRKGGGG